jgi:N-acetylmuramoyl-L-alanine amidase
MAKVYLSPAYHYFNRCAVPGCDETTHNNLYIDQLEVYLTACGIDWKRGPRRVPKSNEDGNQLMIRAVRESDAWGADVHYVSHTNAYDGTVRGYRPMIYPGSARGKRLAEAMMAERRKIYDQPITLFERGDLYELRVPAAASYYEEHVFHDNAEDAAWFHGNLRAIAESAARGLCSYFGLPFVDPYGAEEDRNRVTVQLPMVAKGDESDAARAAMVLLRDRGYYPNDLSGSDRLFGVKADAAARNFQRDRGLAVDGIVGEETWPALVGE